MRYLVRAHYKIVVAYLIEAGSPREAEEKAEKIVRPYVITEGKAPEGGAALDWTEAAQPIDTE